MYLACMLVPVTLTHFLGSKKLGLNVVLNHMTLQVFEIMAFSFPRKFDGPGVNSVDTLTLTHPEQEQYL